MTNEEERQVTKPTSPPFTYRIKTLLFLLQSFCSQYNCVVMFLQGSFFASTSDSFEAGTRVSKSGKWTVAFDISYNIKITEILWYFLGCQVLSFY